MKLTGGRNLILLLMAGVIVFSVTLFWLCYTFDNKYTASGPQPENGLLMLGNDTLEKHPVVFLTNGWEIHRGKLLTPDDFAEELRPDEYVYIGQYGGFEGSDAGRSPHGSATYRINIIIPSTPAAYALELPEIYSAYTLYINGVKVEQFGNPDPANYRPQTGNSIISFLAQNRIEIIVAVSDFSHMYSGMVYPPAFGIAQAVAGMIHMRLIIRVVVCTIALALTLLFLAVSFRMPSDLHRGKDTYKDRATLLFGMICLCFVGYTCYPLVKSIIRGGLWWYGIENFCFCAMLLLVMLLQRTITGDKSKFLKIFIAFGTLVCALSLARVILPSGVPRLLAAYSLLLDIYIWSAAFFLTVNMIRSAGKNTQYGATMLAGILFFDCALVMDRLLPLFEPIHFGWFTEIGGFAIVVTLGIVMVQEALRHYRDKLALEGKIEGIESFVEMQRGYYPVIMESVDKALRASHDLRHHVNVIRGFVSSGKQKELMEYTEKYAAEFSGMSPFTFCENDVVDVILRHFAILAERDGISFTVDAAIPETLPIENADLCTVISNLLENALEACAYINASGFGVADAPVIGVSGDKSINVIIKQIGKNLTILVDNSFDGTVKIRRNTIMSRKRNNREGIGLASVRAVAEKYGGGAQFKPDHKRRIFHSEVIMHICT